MSERKVIPMFEKPAGTGTRQFAFRVQPDEADRIREAAEEAGRQAGKEARKKITPAEFVRLAVLEKLNGTQGREQHLQRKLDALDAKLSALGEQIASLAFEVRDFRERFDETVITASED
jgi:predicted nuclease with TOPRIM domain